MNQQRGLPKAYQRRNTELMDRDPAYLRQVTMSNFGMDPKTLESVMNVMMSVSQGNMPSSQNMQPIYQMAQQKYGWGKDRVLAEMRTAISQPSPLERMNAYLSANNLENVDKTVFKTAVDLVQNGLRGDLEASIYNRLQESQSVNSPDRRFEGMPTTDRIIADSKDKAGLRSTLSQLMGVNERPSYQSKVNDVLKARNQLADRVEVKAHQKAAGHEPSLRESLSDTYDEKFVDAASVEVGLGSPLEEAREIASESDHLAEGYDVTQNI